MNTEEWAAQVNGTLEAVILACTSMIATHPEKEKVLSLLQSLSGHSSDEPQDNSQTKYYKLGIRTVVATIANGVETVRHAESMRSLDLTQPGN